MVHDILEKNYTKRKIMNSKNIKLVFDACNEILVTTGLNTMGCIAKITSYTPVTPFTNMVLL